MTRALFGPANANWKGDAANDGHDRCRVMYPDPLGRCENGECQNDAVDRHHRDRNSLNNDRSNVQFVCRACHQQIDGRAAARVAEMVAAIKGTTRSPETRALMAKAKREAWASGRYAALLARRGEDGRWQPR